jgi:hypothetical protein
LGMAVLSDTLRQKPRARMKETQLNPQVANLAPAGPTLTMYDEKHVITYMACLMPINKVPTGGMSRGSCCASTQTTMSIARIAFESHLSRARWMTEQG